MAEVVGREGHVTAIEVDSELASRARDNLNDFPNVEVIEGDGG
jgi:protein-L-isoaspartate(D-aspartate) O-methyltransferase